MKNLQLKNMLLVSHREKKARKIKFDPELTVIQGENDTGKSSVIKSIQQAFGASPHNVHKKWQDADVITLIEFSLDNVEYYIFRHRNSFSLFDTSKGLIGTYGSVTNELGPKLAQLFDFRLKITDREGYSVTPPPAYLMLPFYIDQDKGWVGTWGSFKHLTQFAYWKPRVAGYHFGIRPDKWYQLEAKKKNLEAEKDEPQRQVNALQAIRDKTLSDFSSVDFDIDFDKFKQEINQLLERCNALKAKEQKYKNDIVSLKTERIRLKAQIDIVIQTHDELSDDYKYSTKAGDSVDCPTCGAHYENSFHERFEIAEDTETCRDLLSSLQADLLSIEKDISKAEAEMNQMRDSRLEINKLLAKKQGDIKLKDLIDIEGKKSLLVQVDKELEQHAIEIGRIELQISRTSEEMEKYDNPEHRKKIVAEYGEQLRRHAFKLNVHSLDDKVFKSITPAIEESGSDFPRAVLAYFFATLDAIYKNGNATFFPIVIDAPNQQEQDRNNLNKVLEFIRDNRPKDKQMVIGLVESGDVDFGGTTIVFDRKLSVLDEGFYAEGAKAIKHFETANLAIEDQTT